MAQLRSLVELNTRIHEEIDEQALLFLEALTALDLDEARACFARFRSRLEAHMAFEDQEVLPLLTRVHEAHGVASDPLPRQVEGDHRILERSLRKAEAALDRLGGVERSAQRRALVLDLDLFLLLRRVLEHHDERETRLAYPLLDAHLSTEERAALLTGLLSDLRERADR